jgi:tetratricopeptide (TPR) repeat protein
MSEGSGDGGTAETLLAEGEQALVRGDSAAAFQLLERASHAGIAQSQLHRLATAFAMAARLQNKHADVLDWIETAIASADGDARQRAALLRARVAVCRQLDLNRVLEIAEDALQAAEKAGDEQAYASVLSHAAFAGYRRGDSRVCQDYAERAASRTFTSPEAHYDAVRAQMFCATSLGDLEAALNFATKARAMARELERPADVANESNNLAEGYLELGYPAEARACAEAAVTLARQSGHRGVELFGQVMIGSATAEVGDIDEAIEQFALIGPLEANRIFWVDFATTFSYWLLERGAAGDAARARDIAEDAIERAAAVGVANRLTALYSNVARAYTREGKADQAVDALEKARRAADRAEPRGQSLLALAVAEVLPVSDSKRKMALTHARARILRSAERREDPRAYCARVRLHRRILELSGGVPTDLPEAQ